VENEHIARRFTRNKHRVRTIINVYSVIGNITQRVEAIFIVLNATDYSNANFTDGNWYKTKF